MFKRGLAVCFVLGMASVASAGTLSVGVDLTVSDLGPITFGPDGKVTSVLGDFVNETPPFNIQLFDESPAPNPDGSYNGGEQLLVHVWATNLTGASFNAREAQVDWRGPMTTLPESSLGLDINNLNLSQVTDPTTENPWDGISNFWFDYSDFGGTFPADGTRPFGPVTIPTVPSNYGDFSNLRAGQSSAPAAPVTVWTALGASGEGPDADMWTLAPGEATHIGAMPVTLPREPGEYTLDLVRPDTSATVNDGFRILHNFSSPENFLAADGSAGYNPGRVGGPITFVVVPEPATLALLAIGGVAVLRRRRTA